jgi:hypothetical protein
MRSEWELVIFGAESAGWQASGHVIQVIFPFVAMDRLSFYDCLSFTMTELLAGRKEASMRASHAQSGHEQRVDEIIDIDRYPLAEPGGERWMSAVADARLGLLRSGCAVLPGFVPAGRLAALRAECASLEGHAFEEERQVNVYNTHPDVDLPAGHPARHLMPRGNAFVARDSIPEHFIIHRLYVSGLFQRFLAECLGRPRVHPYADPLAGLVVNIVRPGREHPWHFDTNEFAVSMVTQAPESGGAFEYVPGIRTANSENFPAVAAVLRGDGGDLAHALPLSPGDLQIFLGRYSMHRVRAVRGNRARYSAIFSYSDQPGVIGNAERSRQLFGRTTAVHEGPTRRRDELLD